MRNPQNKVLTLAAALEWRAQVKRAGGTVVVTNGCFDVLHRGHAESLVAARRLGHVLLVLLNSDDSVRRLKGPTRPIHNEQDRAYVLAALEAVSAVVIFPGERCDLELAQLAPDIYAKSVEYRECQDPAEAASLATCGAETVWLPVLDGYSTTTILAGGATPAPPAGHQAAPYPAVPDGSPEGQRLSGGVAGAEPRRAD